MTILPVQIPYLLGPVSSTSKHPEIACDSLWVMTGWIGQDGLSCLLDTWPTLLALPVSWPISVLVAMAEII